MFAFSVFQIWLPLGYVFDVNAAQAPVRGSEFYQRKQTRAAGSPLPAPLPRLPRLVAGPPVRDEIHNGAPRETQTQSPAVVPFQDLTRPSPRPQSLPRHSTSELLRFCGAPLIF